MKFYFTLGLYLLFHVSTAQVTFQKTFGSVNTSISDNAYDLTSDFEFNYYSIGTSFGNIFVTKIDSLGDILWSKSYLKGNGLKIFATSDSNLVMVSQASLDFSGNAYLSILKIDTMGMIIWGKNYLLGGSMALNTVSIVVDIPHKLTHLFRAKVTRQS